MVSKLEKWVTFSKKTFNSLILAKYRDQKLIISSSVSSMSNHSLHHYLWIWLNRHKTKRFVPIPTADHTLDEKRRQFRCIISVSSILFRVPSASSAGWRFSTRVYQREWPPNGSMTSNKCNRPPSVQFQSMWRARYVPLYKWDFEFFRTNRIHPSLLFLPPLAGWILRDIQRIPYAALARPTNVFSKFQFKHQLNYSILTK